MLASLFKAIGQLSDPRTRRVLWKAIGGAVVVYLTLVGLVAALVTQTALFTTGWLEGVADVLGVLIGVILPLIFFPATVTIVAGLFLEEVADAVEARHYPHLPPARDQPLREALATTVRFAGLTIALNILALPLYLIPVVNLAVFYGLNGYLLGREYYELVAVRRMEIGQSHVLRRAHLGRLWVAGAVITFMLSIPFVNLLAPVIGTAFMLHEFESLRRKSSFV